ncbi:thioredoxin-like [Mercenaria mercenaria]|uniref:thioredoxin-like n=1 Tax=Mercenaria mercenaria TaxID=6596 RepID=UPI00234EC7B8|nr:thioredoxin-like [Mercenaria mercenaria]
MPVTECESKNEYEAQLANNGSKLIVVDFTTARCELCKLIKPKFYKLSKAYPHVVFLKVDVDENSEIAAEWGISAMPTFIYIKNRGKVDELVGTNAVELEAKINKNR